MKKIMKGSYIIIGEDPARFGQNLVEISGYFLKLKAKLHLVTFCFKILHADFFECFVFVRLIYYNAKESK